MTVLIEKRAIGEFKNFLDAQGVEWRESTASYQVIQIHVEPDWLPLYTSGKYPDHFRCDKRLADLVQAFERVRGGGVLVNVEDLCDLLLNASLLCDRVKENEQSIRHHVDARISTQGDRLSAKVRHFGVNYGV